MEKKYYMYHAYQFIEKHYTEQILTENNTALSIGFYLCYEQNGNFYDLLTDELLTPISLKDPVTKEVNKIYISKQLAEISKKEVLRMLKNMKIKELRQCKKIILNKFKIKTDIVYENNVKAKLKAQKIK